MNERLDIATRVMAGFTISAVWFDPKFGDSTESEREIAVTNIAGLALRIADKLIALDRHARTPAPANSGVGKAESAYGKPLIGGSRD